MALTDAITKKVRIATPEFLRRTRMAAEGDSRASLQSGVHIVAWALVLFMTTRPFDLLLAGIDPSGSQNQVTKPFGDYLHLLIGVGVGVYVLHRRALGRVVEILLTVPVLVIFALYAAASVAWSESDLGSAVRDGLGLICTVFSFAAAIAVLPRTTATRALLVAMCICVAASLLWAVALPHYGQHDRNDIYQASHVGKWRGVYRHKNILGQVAGISVGALVSSGRLLPPTLRYTGILIGVICLAFAQSASGMLIAAAGAGFYFSLFHLKGYFRVVAVTGGGLLCLVLTGAGSEILTSILTAIGKDPTFSGRTYLWDAAAQLISDKWLLGYGLSSIYDVSITSVFSKISGEVHDAHNAYLELTIALGLIGLFLYLAAVGDALIKGLTAHVSGLVEEARRMYLVILIMWLLGALVESAPFMTKGAVSTFGLFAVVWLASLSLHGLDPTRSRKAKDPVNQPQLSVRGYSGSKPLVDLD